MTTAPEVLVVETGVANTASVMVGLRRLGCSPRLAENPEELRDANRVVLPGVGAFAAAMRRLRESRMTDALRNRIESGKPTLAVCLGLQLLCEGSGESPGETGLGILPVTAERYPDYLRVPQLGWNWIEPQADCQLIEPGYAYFANSYRVVELPKGWTGATANHGGPFVAALERGAVLACQFHPELSSTYGRELLGRWLEKGA